MINRPVLVTALSVSLFAACGDPAHDTAKFSTADDAHLQRTLAVIGAGDAGQVYLLGAFTSGDNQVGCPTIASTGPVTTITGGCTNGDGVLVEGRVVVTNVQPIFSENPAYDPTKPSLVEAQDLRTTNAGVVHTLDGKVTLTPAGSGLENGGTLDAVVDANDGVIAAHTDVSYTCDATELCTLVGESWVDVDGVGEASLSGTFRFDEPRTGTITARGAETLVLDVVASADRCKAFSIDGGAGRILCEAEESGRQVPALRFFPRDARPMLSLR